MVVDLRPDSLSFGKHYSVVLSAENKLQLFMPKGFAHGFVALSKEAEFFYKCDSYYNKESEGSVLYSDQDLGIDWKIPSAEIIVSDKDKESESFAAFKKCIAEKI